MYDPPKGREYLATSPTAFMALAEKSECPPQRSPQYVKVSNISEGTFVKLMRFWNDLTSSSQSFAQATARIAYMLSDSDGYLKARAAVSKNSASPLALGLIFLDSGFQRPPYFYLTGAGAQWSVIVDIADDKVAILGFGTSTP